MEEVSPSSPSGMDPVPMTDAQAMNKHMSSPPSGVATTSDGASAPRLVTPTQSPTNKELSRKASMKFVQHKDVHSQAMGRKAELEELRQKQLAKKLGKEYSQTGTEAVPFSTSELTDFFLKQKELGKEWRKKQSDSKEYLHRYRNKASDSPKKARSETTKKSYPVSAYTTMSEFDYFFYKQKAAEKERRDKYKDSMDHLHRYKDCSFEELEAMRNSDSVLVSPGGSHEVVDCSTQSSLSQDSSVSTNVFENMKNYMQKRLAEAMLCPLPESPQVGPQVGGRILTHTTEEIPALPIFDQNKEATTPASPEGQPPRTKSWPERMSEAINCPLPGSPLCNDGDEDAPSPQPTKEVKESLSLPTNSIVDNDDSEGEEVSLESHPLPDLVDIQSKNQSDNTEKQEEMQRIVQPQVTPVASELTCDIKLDMSSDNPSGSDVKATNVVPKVEDDVEAQVDSQEVSSEESKELEGQFNDINVSKDVAQAVPEDSQQDITSAVISGTEEGQNLDEILEMPPSKEDDHMGPINDGETEKLDAESEAKDVELDVEEGVGKSNEIPDMVSDINDVTDVAEEKPSKESESVASEEVVLTFVREENAEIAPVGESCDSPAAAALRNDERETHDMKSGAAALKATEDAVIALKETEDVKVKVATDGKEPKEIAAVVDELPQHPEPQVKVEKATAIGPLSHAGEPSDKKADEQVKIASSTKSQKSKARGKSTRPRKAGEPGMTSRKTKAQPKETDAKKAVPKSVARTSAGTTATRSPWSLASTREPASTSVTRKTPLARTATTPTPPSMASNDSEVAPSKRQASSHRHAVPPKVRFPYTPKKKTDRSYKRLSSDELSLICTSKWIPNVHSSRGGCERCLHFASQEETDKFQSMGHHYRVNMVRGGCVRSCSYFPRKENEPPVRLCPKCFYDTHIGSRMYPPRYMLQKITP